MSEEDKKWSSLLPLLLFCSRLIGRYACIVLCIRHKCSNYIFLVIFHGGQGQHHYCHHHQDEIEIVCSWMMVVHEDRFAQSSHGEH